MTEQGKRLLLAVTLALGFMLIWTKFFSPKDADQQKPATPTAGSAQPTAEKPRSMVGVSSETPAAAEPRGPEQKIKLTFPRFSATFSSYDGILESWHLADKRYERDSTHGDLLPKLPNTGLGYINFVGTYALPAKAEWIGTKVSDTEVKYTLSTPQFEVTKVYDVVPEAYLVKLNVSFTVKVPAGKDARETLAVMAYGFQDPNDKGGGGRSVQPRVWESSTMRDGTIVSTPVKGLVDQPRQEVNIQWTGFEHPYLLVGVSPRPVEGHTVDKHTFAEPSGLMKTELIMQPEGTFHAGASAPVSREVVAYLGPKSLDQLNMADEAAGFATRFNAVIDFGWFAFISRPMLWLLRKFYAVFGNWGVSIVLLTLLVKLATLYWTTKSMRSMKAMAVLSPQMKALQERYKDDKQRLQVETMALYKQHGANPLSGCLPLFLQMPIWLALYRMLQYAGELYLQPFIPGWIDDLTTSDPYYVLPVVLVVVMFVQARLTPASPDPSQRTQQKIMQYGMPLGFGAMSFFFPAGSTLYILTNTCLSALHSIYMNKFDKKSVELAAKLKDNQQKVAQAKQNADVKQAKDANPPRAVTTEDDEGEAPASAPAQKGIAARQRPKRKKGRR